MSRDTSCLAVDAKLRRNLKFPGRVSVLLSPMLFIWGLSVTPNEERGSCLPHLSVFSPQIWLTFVTLYWGLGGFALEVPVVSGSSLEFSWAIWLRCFLYMISVICSICQMGRKIGFELRRGESVVVNKRNAGLHPDMVQRWKRLWFLPPAAGRSFWVHSLAFGSPYPLTTRLFSLLLRPSAPNSWTSTGLTTTPKEVLLFSGYTKSGDGTSFGPATLPPEGDQILWLHKASICFALFTGRGGLRRQFMVSSAKCQTCHRLSLQ